MDIEFCQRLSQMILILLNYAPEHSLRIYYKNMKVYRIWLSRWLSGQESACQAGDMGSIPELGRFPGEGNSYPFQYSCLGSPYRPGGCEGVGHDLVTNDNNYSVKRLTITFI